MNNQSELISQAKHNLYEDAKYIRTLAKSFENIGNGDLAAKLYYTSESIVENAKAMDEAFFARMDDQVKQTTDNLWRTVELAVNLSVDTEK